MPAFQTASYYTRPKIKVEDIELENLRCLREIVAQAIDSLMVDPFYPPDAMFACAYAEDRDEPPSTLLVTFPLTNPDEPAELRVDLEEVVNEMLRTQWRSGGPDPETHEAITAIADMLDAQARKLRTALNKEPIHG